MVELICEFCKCTFSVPPGRKDEARFCSRRCHADWRKENGSNAGAQLLESCRERDCDGPAHVYSARMLVNGQYRRSHRCKICGMTFKTYAHTDGSFGDWLHEEVKHPPKRLTALALFNETLLTIQLSKSGGK